MLADRFGAPVAELEIVFAATGGVGVADDQEAIAVQHGMIKRVRHQPDRTIRLRADPRRIEVEINRDSQLRHLVELLE